MQSFNIAMRYGYLIDCPNYETTGEKIDNKYQYKMVDIRGWEDYIMFDIMACGQGHIALADQEDVHNTKNVYEILIGRKDNTGVAVRYAYIHPVISGWHTGPKGVTCICSLM